MEYIYAAMLIHKAGKKVDESTLKKVLESVTIKPDDAKIKALVAALSDVDIDKVIKEASALQIATAPSQPAEAKEKKEEKKEEKKGASEEEAAAGLGALFG